MARGPRLNENTLNRLLPYGFLCTVGPSVSAATNLFVVRYVICRYYLHSRDPSHVPEPGDEICNDPSVEAIAGSVMAGLATLDGICSFLSSSYIQFLADRFGRRPLLITLPLLATVSTMSMPIAFWWNSQIAMWILLVTNGVFVSASTKSIFVPTLCVADVASESTRTRFYSRLEAVGLLGPVLAFIASALMSRYSSIITMPYYVALGSQLLASLYATVMIPETLSSDAKEEDESEISSQEAEDEDEGGALIHDAILAPVKPLALLLPHRDSETGRWHWRLTFLTISLLATTAGTVFISTASLLFLSDKFQFNPENNAWFLAYLTSLRLGYLVFIFPLVLKYGRRMFAWVEERRKNAAKGSGETRPLLGRQGSLVSEGGEKETNHFDVILAFLSVVIDAVSLSFVTLASGVRQVLGSFAGFAFGAGDNPSFKSVFVSAVPPEHASEALAALDMVLAVAKLASPPILGSFYAAFVKGGRPELVFLAAGGFCAIGAVFIAPLLFAGRRSRSQM
ncbi:major facilitator superfamily domain-containing protein [Naematelia encephala]|uniref:Major facilitator superfamily domain-containing protein n=1 Tax=Naematelia encephala TaxID=71784 RepID=A0A1Y2AWY9_9TREE|nr:major facilitator superfamily domain-containing protein [Naematelia encephala]